MTNWTRTMTYAWAPGKPDIGIPGFVPL